MIGGRWIGYNKGNVPRGKAIPCQSEGDTTTTYHCFHVTLDVFEFVTFKVLLNLSCNVLAIS